MFSSINIFPAQINRALESSSSRAAEELELFAARMEAWPRFQPRAEARRLRHRVDGDGKWSL